MYKNHWLKRKAIREDMMVDYRDVMADHKNKRGINLISRSGHHIEMMDTEQDIVVNIPKTMSKRELLNQIKELQKRKQS